MRVAATVFVTLLTCSSAFAMGDTMGDKAGLVPLNLPRQTVEAAHAPRRLALLVSVNQFDDPAWRRLRYPDKDVADLGRVLADPRRGGFTHVETLQQATLESLREALQHLASANRDDRDLVVVYLSTHGTLTRDARGQLRRYLVTRDTRLADVSASALSLEELKNRFDTLPSRRKLLILAACHSGGGKSLLPGGLQSELEGIKAGFFVRPLEEVSRASTVLAAADWGETAREDEVLENDIYTHFLVEALQLEADRNGDGAVTASEAHDYARRRTYEYTGGRQRPTAETTEVGADPIVLVGQVRRKGRPELYSYTPALDGFTLRIDGRPAADLPGGIALDAGLHQVQLSKGDSPSILDLPVTFSTGDRIDVQDLLARADGRWEVAPRLALLGFLDDRSRRDVLGTVAGAGVALTLREWPARRMALRIDVAGSTGSSIFRRGATSARQNYSLLTTGAALVWRFPLSAGPGVALLAGPRLSAVYLTRRFELQIGGELQSYFVFTPGVLLGAGWDLSSRFSLGAELQLDWTLLQIDGQNRSSGFGGLLLGGGYRF